MLIFGLHIYIGIYLDFFEGLYFSGKLNIEIKYKKLRKIKSLLKEEIRSGNNITK